ncbi:ASCH_domain-containing protein [Hexamita inflata]|uniref:ASCH domain-containing protein n=1 Tax=Hexamita inflata TaxID=28002 RepID=A0AA86USN1_9EUKA|nr:ASCH domain-containing protein [Hexamita inflata]
MIKLFYKNKNNIFHSKTQFHVQEPFFSLISAGIKTVEGRLNRRPFSDLKTNDVVFWFNGEQRVKTTIIRKTVYDSFQLYIEAEGMCKCLPNQEITTIQQGVDIYRKFYSVEDEKTHGVLAIQIQLEEE